MRITWYSRVPLPRPNFDHGRNRVKAIRLRVRAHRSVSHLYARCAPREQQLGSYWTQIQAKRGPDTISRSWAGTRTSSKVCAVAWVASTVSPRVSIWFSINFHTRTEVVSAWESGKVNINIRYSAWWLRLQHVLMVTPHARLYSTSNRKTTHPSLTTIPKDEPQLGCQESQRPDQWPKLPSHHTEQTTTAFFSSIHPYGSMSVRVRPILLHKHSACPGEVTRSKAEQ